MQVSKRIVGSKPQKGWAKWIFLLVIWLLTLSMFKDFLRTKKGFLRVEESNNRLKEAKMTNETLTRKLGVVSSPEYKEKLIREKLNMQRQGEIVVILPGGTAKTIRQDETDKNMENWQKWVKVWNGDF